MWEFDDPKWSNWALRLLCHGQNNANNLDEQNQMVHMIMSLWETKTNSLFIPNLMVAQTVYIQSCSQYIIAMGPMSHINSN